LVSSAPAGRDLCAGHWAAESRWKLFVFEEPRVSVPQDCFAYGELNEFNSLMTNAFSKQQGLGCERRSKTSD
jgi:hypothetical protein